MSTAVITDIERSLDYFSSAEPKIITLAAKTGQRETYASEDGLFSFVFSSPDLADKPRLAKRVKQYKYYLKGFMSLVAGKLFEDNDDDVRKAFQIPPANVKEVATHLPLIDTFASSKATNKQAKTNLEFSADFLKLAIEMAVGAEAAAALDVSKWLSNVGQEAVKISASSASTSFNFTMFSAIMELVGAGKVVDIRPKFRIAGTNLDVGEIKAALNSCVKAELFTLNFEADCFTAGLNFDALDNPDIKGKVDRLITKGLVSEIDNSANYFDVGV